MTDTADPAARPDADPARGSSGAPARPTKRVVKVVQTGAAARARSERAAAEQAAAEQAAAEARAREDAARRRRTRPDLAADYQPTYTGPAVDIFDGKGWWSLIAPFKPAKPGTMPAGLVLAVVFFGLVVAMFVNADATLRKSNAKDATGWRHTVADAISFATGRDGSPLEVIKQPRRALDDLRGVDVDTSGADDDTDALLARQQAEESGSGSEGGGPVTTLPTRPVLRKPVPGQPLKLWVGGDSITGAFGPALQKVATDTTLFNAESFSKASSGLTRPDFFNWPDYLYNDVVAKTDPDVMVIMFGANDSQGMPAFGREPVHVTPLSPDWLNAYRDRVGATMDLLRGDKNDRLVVWMGAPNMGQFSGVEGMELLNHIYATEAAVRPWVVYFDTPAFLSNPDGSYAASLPNAEGETQLLRASDNIHLNTDGANRVSWGVLQRIGQEIDLTGAPIVVPPGQSAPADVVGRTEIPRPPNWPEGAKVDADPI